LEIFHARAEVRLAAENGVADVIVMRHLRAVEKERVLEFARIADDAVVANNDVFAEIGVVADLAVLADDGGTFDDAPGSTTVPSPMNTFAPMLAPGKRLGGFCFGTFGEVVFDFLERVPGEVAAVEKGGVFRLREVKQVGRFEHDGRLKQRRGAEK
jgi:hypothetical protein